MKKPLGANFWFSELQVHDFSCVNQEAERTLPVSSNGIVMHMWLLIQYNDTGVMSFCIFKFCKFAASESFIANNLLCM